jgi:hypothetical protein
MSGDITRGNREWAAATPVWGVLVEAILDQLAAGTRAADVVGAGAVPGVDSIDLTHESPSTLADIHRAVLAARDYLCSGTSDGPGFGLPHAELSGLIDALLVLLAD